MIGNTSKEKPYQYSVGDLFNLERPGIIPKLSFPSKNGPYEVTIVHDTTGTITIQKEPFATNQVNIRRESNLFILCKIKEMPTVCSKKQVLLSIINQLEYMFLNKWCYYHIWRSMQYTMYRAMWRAKQGVTLQGIIIIILILVVSQFFIYSL